MPEFLHIVYILSLYWLFLSNVWGVYKYIERGEDSTTTIMSYLYFVVILGIAAYSTYPGF